MAYWMCLTTAVVSTVALAIACTGAAHAAHPLVTEDTASQGVGNVEIENALGWTRTGLAKAFSYQPQVSLGLLPAFDLIVQPSWSVTQDGGTPAVRGWGDTNLDAKWRYHGEAPWSFAVRAGLGLATSQRGLGMRHGAVSPHAVWVATYEEAPLAVHLNLAYTRNPGDNRERKHIARVSSAVMWTLNEALILTADVSAECDPDPARGIWPGSVLLGAIWTAQPGLDVDMGYQTSVRATEHTRQWLLGVTYRFAP